MTDTFRRRQLLADLGAVARGRPISAICRIATAVRPAGTSAARLPGLMVAMVAGGSGSLSGPAARDLSESLRFAAVMPEADFEGFLGATAILLSDTLQGGGAARDLPWIWDAGREHYALAGPAVRSALLRGFAAAFEAAGTDIAVPLAARLTDSPGDVDRRLAAARAPIAGTLRAALTAPGSGRSLGALWQAHAADLLRAREEDPAEAALLAGFRHAYESRPGFDPETPHLLPFPGA